MNFTSLIVSGVNGSVTLGDGLTQSGRYSGGHKSPSGVQGRRPNRESSGRTPKLILILEMDVKPIFYGGKIENAYMSRCFLVLGAARLSS